MFESLDPVFEECVTRGKVTFIRASQEGERPRSSSATSTSSYYKPISPPFIYMPSRDQMMKLIAKAAEYASV